MVTAMNATSSNKSTASGKEELVKNKNEVPATSLTEMVLCPKHLSVLGVGGWGGEHKLSALVLFIPVLGNKYLIPLNTAYKDC